MEQYTPKEQPAEAVHTEASASPSSPRTPKKPLSAVLKWALILAIIIVVNVFFASVIQLIYPAHDYANYAAWIAFGIILILISVLIPKLGAIMYGFSLGGVISLIVGTMGYWSDMRVLVLGVALITLIILGVWKFRD